jgi:hypothetical protein
MDNSVSNVRVVGMFGTVGKRGEIVPLNASINVPILAKVVSYDKITSILVWRFLWAPANTPTQEARVIAPRVGGQGPAAEVCKLEPGDTAYVLRHRKESAPVTTDNPADFEWVSFISGSGVDCETPIVVSRVIVTPDCKQVDYDTYLRGLGPQPPFSSDYPWANWCILDANFVGWSEFDVQTGTMKNYARFWPIISKIEVTLAVDPSPGSGRCEKLQLLAVTDQIGSGYANRP